MADTAEGQSTDANSQEASSAPSTEQAQDQSANTSTGENTGAAQSSEQRIPYPRFHEVVEQKNAAMAQAAQKDARIRELEARLQPTHQVNQDQEVQRLVNKLGMSEEAAREIVATQQAVAGREREAVEGRLRQMEVKGWTENLSRKFKDYDEYVPQMEKVWNEMPPQAQALVVASPHGLEMLYKSVRADSLEAKVQESFNKGANQAYQNKAQKQAATSLPGASAAANPSKLTRESIANMSIEEYSKRLPEINEAIKARSI